MGTAQMIETDCWCWNAVGYRDEGAYCFRCTAAMQDSPLLDTIDNFLQFFDQLSVSDSPSEPLHQERNWAEAKALFGVETIPQSVIDAVWEAFGTAHRRIPQHTVTQARLCAKCNEVTQDVLCSHCQLLASFEQYGTKGDF